MNNYAIYCTEEQTKKALELGAPIRKKVYPIEILNKCYLINHKGQIKIIPTAEEMIGWLEAECKVIDFIVCYDMGFTNDDFEIIDTYCYKVYFEDKHKCDGSGFSTKKEATLAAIDAALDYLKAKEK